MITIIGLSMGIIGLLIISEQIVHRDEEDRE